MALAQDAAAEAEADTPPVPAGAGSAAGQIAVNPKITPQLPPPPPAGSPTTAFSNCSGYVTKEEIMAGLEYAAGKEYMPFDQWCALLLHAATGVNRNPLLSGHQDGDTLAKSLRLGTATPKLGWWDTVGAHCIPHDTLISPGHTQLCC